MRPSDSVVRQTMVPHLASRVHESLWVYTAAMSGFIVHCAKAKIIHEKCWCRLIPVEVLIMNNVGKMIAS